MTISTHAAMAIRAEASRLDDAQAIWDLLAARGRVMRSPRPE